HNDIVIKSAAVADYRPKVVYDEKMKKKDNDQVEIEMERTKDILASLGENKAHQFLVGFAAETTSSLKYVRKKLTEKNLDAIVVTIISTQGAGFEGDTNIATYVNKH